MSILLQFVLPFAVALLVLALFHLVTYAHIRLAESEGYETEERFGEDFG